MFEYEKTLLYVYPKIVWMKTLYYNLAETKIFRSYQPSFDTSALCEEIVDCIFLQKAFDELQKRMDCIMEHFTKEERIILEYRFFRRKKYLKGEYENYAFSFSYSSFLRRIREVTKKFSCELKSQGYGEEEFFSDYAKSDLMMKIYANVKSRKDVFLLRGVPMSFSFREGKKK